jgi:protein involved in polysaccharide export with SLBB domain
MLAFPSLQPRSLLVSAIAGLTMSQVVLAAPPVLPAPQTQSDPTSATPAAFRQESSAATPRAAAYDRTMGVDSPPIPSLMAGEGDYILAPGDTLDLMVYREPDLGMRSKIARDGRVQLPLLGEVKVAGMSVRDAQEHIRKLYDADYLVDPQVYLNISSYTQRKITVIGQVSRPGSYELQGNESLGILEAIGMAGGFTRIADTKNVVVKRRTGEKVETIKVNTKRLESPEGGSFQVLPGDILTVGESWY